jgi:hypothetical protein
MGSELVVAVGALGATGQLDGLSIRAKHTLDVMASTALDRDAKDGRPARHYFAGWELIAAHLGYSREVIDGPGRDVARRAVGRAMAELVAAGHIKQVGRTGPHGNRVWLLASL